jgi:hypothetical protein
LLQGNITQLTILLLRAVAAVVLGGMVAGAVLVGIKIL